MAVVNPIVIVEVTSEGTELYDRNEKRECYQPLASLMEYVVVSHRERRIDVWRRRAASSAGRGESVAVTSIECRVSVDELYRGIL